MHKEERFGKMKYVLNFNNSIIKNTDKSNYRLLIHEENHRKIMKATKQDDFLKFLFMKQNTSKYVY